MFAKIMIPVDLAHTEQMGKALEVAAETAKLHGAEACLVGVTQSAPTDIAPNPEAFAERLAGFAAERSEGLGVPFKTHSEVSHDISVELETMLTRAADTIGADLIVMASHKPGLAEHIFASHAGYLASHADMSVFVVR
ncbi:MAG: universal stress protein [Pseudomonadota bacterium]